MTVLVAGEALVDLIVRPDGCVAASLGGGPFNAARTLALQGCPTAFLGALSDDRWGQVLRARLERDGVRLALPAPLSCPTTLAVAELDEDGTARYAFHVEGTSAPRLGEAEVRAAVTDEVTVVHLGSLGLVLEPMASSLEHLLTLLGPDVLVFVDVNARPQAVRDPAAYGERVRRVLARADVVKVSGEDLGYLDAGRTALGAARNLLVLGPRVVLLTDGGSDVHVLTAEHEQALPVPHVDVVDTVGAGDAFGGGFLAAWTAAGLGREDLRDEHALRVAVGHAIAVASLTCTRAGAEPPARDHSGSGRTWLR